MLNWLAIQDCELLNTPDEYTYTHYSENSSSVIDLTFSTPLLCNFVKNWQIKQDMETESDHEVIQFQITANESEWVESPLNAPYNIDKAD